MILETSNDLCAMVLRLSGNILSPREDRLLMALGAFGSVKGF
jgi:hypothetical protein